jgi:hypothetical protein
MKFEYWEGVGGLEIKMIPETPKEAAQLLRISKNAKAEKPSLYFSFSGDEPYCNIWLSKVKETVQHNSISNTKL